MKTIQKIVSISLMFLLAAGIISVNENVYASEVETEIKTEETEQTIDETTEETNDAGIAPIAGEISGNGWKLDASGVFTLLSDIDGNQYLDKNTYVYNYPWRIYEAQIKEVVVAEGVTEIPNSAFDNYSNLQKITLSSTVRIVGTHTFARNANLKEVNLNKELEYIEQCAFFESGFEEIKLPPHAKYEGDIFTDCKNLKKVTVPGGSTWVGNANAQFYGCTSLETVIIEEGVTKIPNQFLRGCTNLKYVWLPKSLTPSAFSIFNDNKISDSPIPATCIIGYKGSMAEKYVEHWLKIGSDWTKGMTFHAIDGEEHSFGEGQILKNPTCTEPGMIKQICSICHTEHIQEIAATGHSWDEGKVIKAATENAEGIKTYTCTVCHETKTETIAKLGSFENGNSDEGTMTRKTGYIQNSPNTGDTTNVLTWVMMIVSIGSYMVFDIKKRSAR